MLSIKGGFSQATLNEAFAVKSIIASQNRYSGAEVMWDTHFFYISGFIRTKKVIHEDTSGTERGQDREIWIGIFCYANALEAWNF